MQEADDRLRRPAASDPAAGVPPDRVMNERRFTPGASHAPDRQDSTARYAESIDLTQQDGLPGQPSRLLFAIAPLAIALCDCSPDNDDVEGQVKFPSSGADLIRAPSPSIDGLLIIISSATTSKPD